MPKIIREVSTRLLETHIENKPAVDLIKNHNGPNVLIYADPPYVWATRTHGKAYNHEMTDTDHEELLSALQEHKGMVLLSGYDNGMYNDTLHGWRKETIATIAENAVKRIECLWINPAAAERLNRMGEQMAL
jgi:DNA adenine methylase